MSVEFIILIYMWYVLQRSLEFAIQREKEWQLNKPKEEDEEYEEEAAAEGGEATPAAEEESE